MPFPATCPGLLLDALQVHITNMTERERKDRKELMMARQQADIAQAQLQGSQNELTKVFIHPDLHFKMINSVNAGFGKREAYARFGTKSCDSAAAASACSLGENSASNTSMRFAGVIRT